MKSLTLTIVVISVFLTILGSYLDIYKLNSSITKDLLWHWSPYLISLAIFIELYSDVSEIEKDNNKKKSKN